MSKYSMTVLWVGVVFLGVLLPLRAQTTDADGEMLVNPGFESCPGTATLITLKNVEPSGLGARFNPSSPVVGWWLNPLYPTGITVIADEKMVHTGKRCVKIGYQEPEAAEKAGHATEAALCAGRFSVNPGEGYVFKFWARHDGARSRATIFVYQYDEKFAFIGSSPLAIYVSEVWQEYLFPYEVKDPRTKFIFFAIHTPKEGELFVDDASSKKAVH